jgi:hypothetical protein
MAILIYASPTWEYAADAHLLNLQDLQNRVPCANGDRDGGIQVRDL